MSHQISTSIPPASFYPVRLTGIPTETGELTIRGCHIKLRGCPAQEFILPMWSEKDMAISASKRSSIEQQGRIKIQGVQKVREDEADVEVEKLALIKCLVVQKQPIMRLNKTNLTHGFLMLYNGERYVT
jgi:trafficking protein particle complex subunit 9